MKAQELRLGNYLLHDGRVCWVSGVDSGQIFLSDESQDWLDNERATGVLIMEEWLLKFGFKKVDDYFRIDTIGGYYVPYIQRFIFQQYDSMQADIWWRGNSLGRINIQYIHQLQNLYFALTGEELKLLS